MLYIEPVENEKLYKELEDMGTLLRIPVPQAFLGIKVLDRHGKVIRNTLQRSHSWTRNAYNVLACNLLGLNCNGTWGDGTGTPVKMTNGSVLSSDQGCALAETTVTQSGYSSDPQATGQGYIAGSGDNSFGIVAGIGLDPETFNDYALSSICGEGSGANQLHYVLSEQPVRSWDAGTRTLTITHKRYMNNNSSATITITEIGIVASAATSGGEGRKIVTSRDVLSPPIEVPASGQILASYAIALVFPV